MRHHPWARRTLLSVLIAAIGMPPLAGAEQLSLVQFPPGSSSKQPTPNVIITLDDSSSMRYNLAGKDVGEANTTSGMWALKDALQKTFSAASGYIPDGSIRMAWHSMNNCRAIPSSSGGCGSLNAMRILDATHRANFLNWVGAPGAKANSSKLWAEGGTPTHQTFITAGDYYKNGSTTNKVSPWASVPGTTAEPFLSCRRSYNVLMTDGGWSWEGTASNLNAGASRPTAANPNADNTPLNLPDGQVYDITKDYTRIYRDTYGGQTQGRTYNSTKMTAGAASTLADLAFYYWATDLSTLDNNVPKTTRQDGSQTIVSTTDSSRSVQVPAYWNPKNNPATWQSMTTYTIGFRDAAAWPNNGTYPNWDSVTNDTYGANGSYNDLMTGVRIWPDPMGSDTLMLTAVTDETRKTELWHMAINSRGKFIPTYSSDDMVRAFRDIFSEIAVDNRKPVTGFSNASSSIARSATTQYTSGYLASVEVGGETFKWLGYVQADTLSQNATTGVVSTAPDETWGIKTGASPPNANTAHKLDALSALEIGDRLVLTWSEAGRGTSFQWTQDVGTLSALTTAQKDLLRVEGSGSVLELVGTQRLNFIRGDRTLEGTLFRKRGSRQGDIVNSAPWYVADPVSNYGFDKYITTFAKTHKDRLPMVYVGGNDGMLHGFSGVDGTEKIAYVPKGVYKTLPDLVRSNYDHRYYVDGSPFSGDVNWGDSVNPNWRTLLVGTLGAGGKGYFILDVTTPGSKVTGDTAVASNFLKANAATLVVMDKTSPAGVTPTGSTVEDADIGHIMVAPVVEDNNPQKTTQIVRMNDGRWALVTGNGYNSTNERPVLLIQYLSGEDRSLRKIVAASAGTNASTNGLSAPRLVDIDGNGTPDVIYAGDLRGNLWKFDVSSATPGDWNVAFSGSPLYTAAFISGSTSTPQPITAPPIVRANERGAGGLMVAFGTGRNLTEADRTSTGVQSIYSVLDNTRYKLVSGKVAIDTSTVTPAAVGSGVSQLVQQTVSNTVVAGSGNSTGRNFWTVSQNDVPYTGTGLKKGWYLNLPESGERVLAQMSFYDESNIIELISEVPASGGITSAEESCAPPPTDLKKYRTLVNIMDGKRPSVQVMDTNGNGTYDGASDMYVSRMTASDAENRVTTKTQEIRIGHGSQVMTDKLARLPEIPLRPNWRQLQ